MVAELARETILIVDDAPENIELLGESLRREYNIRVATNGEKALKIALSENPPDLILLDVMMPGMDGYEVCSRLKADERTKKIPVIFITGKGDVEDETKGFRLGAVDYITKPFNTIIVLARVQTHMEVKRHRDMLERFSFRDGLTNIANRRRFDDYLNMVWGYALREASPLGLIMMDIDHFKLFNDNYGHQAGDFCLVQVAQALSGSIRRSTDLVARYGGEEFACILPNTELEGAVKVADTMRKNVLSLCVPHAYSSAGNCVTISQGVAVMQPRPDASPSDLIKNADKMLYCAKEQGRNRFCCEDRDTGAVITDSKQSDSAIVADESLRETVLIVDDAPENIDLLGETLRREYNVRVATSGEKALKIAIEDNPPDIILLDIMMPGLNGFDVCRKLKEAKESRNIPVIFLTIRSETDHIVKGFEVGAADYVTKPFNFDELLARVRTHLDLKRVRHNQNELISNLQTAKENMENALARVRQLSGLLPICSHCQKIRNDRGGWELLEEYIMKHSNAQFSHSICPECVRVYSNPGK